MKIIKTRIYNIKNKKNYSNIHLAIDTYRDFKKIKRILLKQKKNRLNLRDIIKEYEKN